MINKPPPFKGLNIRICIIVPIKGRGFVNQGSGLTRSIVPVTSSYQVRLTVGVQYRFGVVG